MSIAEHAAFRSTKTSDNIAWFISFWHNTEYIRDVMY